MLTTEERIEVAKNVIELEGVTDEDLKQEIYLHSLEFERTKDEEKCKECTKMKQIQCLSTRLTEVVRDYNNEEKAQEQMEDLVDPILNRFDGILALRVAMLMGLI